MDIAELVRECVACPLAWRGSGVPGEWVGGEQGDTMVIGEAPGAVEQAEGRPFVGDSGQLLRSLLADCGLTVYYLTNIVKHRPAAIVRKNQRTKHSAARSLPRQLWPELQSVRPF